MDNSSIFSIVINEGRANGYSCQILARLHTRSANLSSFFIAVWVAYLVAPQSMPMATPKCADYAHILDVGFNCIQSAASGDDGLFDICRKMLIPSLAQISIGFYFLVHHPLYSDENNFENGSISLESNGKMKM